MFLRGIETIINVLGTSSFLTFGHCSGHLSFVDANPVFDEVVVEDQGRAVPVVQLNPELTTYKQSGRFQ